MGAYKESVQYVTPDAYSDSKWNDEQANRWYIAKVDGVGTTGYETDDGEVSLPQDSRESQGLRRRRADRGTRLEHPRYRIGGQHDVPHPLHHARCAFRRLPGPRGRL